jgi:hypothetical protein
MDNQKRKQIAKASLYEGAADTGVLSALHGAIHERYKKEFSNRQDSVLIRFAIEDSVDPQTAVMEIIKILKALSDYNIACGGQGLSFEVENNDGQ